MKRFWILALCALLMFGMVACGNKQQDDGTTTTTTANEEQTPIYALDAVINRFFVDYVAKYGAKALDSQSIHRGAGTANTKPEDLTKEYAAVINGSNITLRNTTYETENNLGQKLTMYQLHITIEGGTTKKSFETLMNTFLQIAPICDPDCSAATAEKAVEKMTKMTTTGSLEVSTFLRVVNFTPIVEEYGIPAKIELMALNYLPLDAE